MRSALCCLALLGTVSACAAGEPLDDGPQAQALVPADGPGADGPGVAGLVYIDVADPQGQPVIAESVWVSSDMQGPIAADCFDLETPKSCPTWFGDFEAAQEVHVMAQVCGETFVGTLSVESMSEVGPASDGLHAAHLTVLADVEGCISATSAPQRKHVDG